MAIQTARIQGKQIGLTCVGAITNWTKASLKLKYEIKESTAADATYKQKVLDILDGSGTITGFQGEDMNAATLPQPGDEIDDLAIAVGADSAIPAALVGSLGKWRVSEVDYDFERDPATWTMQIESGFVD